METEVEKIKQFVEERLKWNEDMMKIDPRASDIGRIEEDKCILRYIEKL
jgi:hypothetical protein